jgi:hypothetical protein
MKKPNKINIDSLEFPYLQIRSVSEVKVTPVYIDISEEGYSQPPWYPSKKAHVKDEYDDIELSLICTPSQYVALVKEIKDPQPGPKTIKLEYKDKTIVFDGFIKEINNIEDSYESEEYVDVNVKFVIHFMEVL